MKIWKTCDGKEEDDEECFGGVIGEIGKNDPPDDDDLSRSTNWVSGEGFAVFSLCKRVIIHCDIEE